MSSLAPDVAASLSFSELRALVVDLIGEVRGLRAENEVLRSENAVLRAGNVELRTTNIALKAEVQSLRDEAAVPLGHGEEGRQGRALTEAAQARPES